MKLKFVINDISYRYLALLTIFDVEFRYLIDLKWKIATFSSFRWIDYDIGFSWIDG